MHSEQIHYHVSFKKCSVTSKPGHAILKKPYNITARSHGIGPRDGHEQRLYAADGYDADGYDAGT